MLTKEKLKEYVTNCTSYPMIYLIVSAFFSFFTYLFQKLNIPVLLYFFMLLATITFVISYFGLTKEAKPIFSYPREKYLGKQIVAGEPGCVNGCAIGCLMILVITVFVGILAVIFGLT